MLSVICSENMHAYDRIKKRTQLYNVKVRVSAAKDAKGFSQRLSLNSNSNALTGNNFAKGYSSIASYCLIYVENAKVQRKRLG